MDLVYINKQPSINTNDRQLSPTTTVNYHQLPPTQKPNIPTQKPNTPPQNPNGENKCEIKRKDYKYYKKAHEIIEQMNKNPKVNSIIDVGGWRGEFIKNTNIKGKTIIDLHKIKNESDGITRISDNFLTHSFKKKYNIVTCLQVLEHIDNKNVINFAQKLFSISNKYVIISVPYKWRKEACKWHLQDPVDHAKLFKWTSRTPFETFIVKDTATRLIAVYKVN